ncbi:MAG: hypothetical protein ACI88C_000022 [Acidimicrobiales bacterium]|jgi:hypothetical protein
MIAALLPLLLAQALPSAPRVARMEHVQVFDVPIDEANNHPGKIISIDMEGTDFLSLGGVTEPGGIVVDGLNHIVRGARFSAQTSATYIYDLTLTCQVNGSHAVSCEPQLGVDDQWDSPMPNALKPGLTYFENCFFGNGTPVMNYRVGYVPDVPGLWQDENGDGRVACKWWVQPKSPRKWGFSGCEFQASQEHAIYLHWAHSARIEDCTFAADGGTAIQAVWRYGRPGTGTYYGNPGMSPPLHGDFIVNRCTFNDEDIWGREASTVTVVGWAHGDIYIHNTKISGSRGAVAIWANAHKGGYAYDQARGMFVFIGTGSDGEVTEVPELVEPTGNHSPWDPRLILNDSMNRQFNAIGSRHLPPGDYLQQPPGWPHGNISIRNLIVGEGPHDREQIMISGFKSGEFSAISVDSHKQHLVLGAHYGGEWGVGKVSVSDTAPDPKYWGGNGYQTATRETHPDWFQGSQPARRVGKRRVGR